MWGVAGHKGVKRRRLARDGRVTSSSASRVGAFLGVNNTLVTTTVMSIARLNARPRRPPTASSASSVVAWRRM
jgi:hypothetical protein